jgi:N-acyl homoserine lactone hydrolase
MPDPRIVPLHVGTGPGRDKCRLVFMQEVGVRIDVALIVWLIQADGNTILVDTGPCSSEVALEKGHRKIVTEPKHRLENQLAAVGTSPEEVDAVVLSHLHWDHCYNNHLFPQARFFVQRAELRYAVAPLRLHAPMYEAPTIGMIPPWVGTHFEVMDGDFDLYPGVHVLHVPGHTPGSQAVLLKTRRGRYVVASDTIPLFENWERWQPDTAFLPYALYVNLEDYYASVARLRTVADVVLPGHDPRVFDRACYP